MKSSHTESHPSHGGPAWLWSALAGVFAAAILMACLWIAGDKEFLRAVIQGMIGFVSTPFFFEATVFFAGLSIVVLLNHWRQKRSGDGWVYLAEDTNPASPGQAPDMHDAVFTSRPDEPSDPVELAEIEGLLDLQAWNDAGEALLALPDSLRESTRALEARARLADALGHPEDARVLRERIRALRSGAQENLPEI